MKVDEHVPIGVDELLREVQEASSRFRETTIDEGLAGPAADDRVTVDLDAAFAPLALVPPLVLGRDQYLYSELTAFHDEVFVRNAYRALLRRDADAATLRKRLEELRGGRAKGSILGSIRYSREGRKAHVRV